MGQGLRLLRPLGERSRPVRVGDLVEAGGLHQIRVALMPFGGVILGAGQGT